MEKYITYIGFFSGFCTTIAFISQAYKVWKTKSTKDISLWMFLIFTA
jgi:MtN3 and saliva related transmembrane protein